MSWGKGGIQQCNACICYKNFDQSHAIEKGESVNSNDQILVDGIIDELVDSRSASVSRDEAFELLAIQQILKDFDLSEDELQQGWTDGSRDGGIDGLYVFVNGHLLQDPLSFHWPKSGAELTVFVITCKHHASFKQAVLDNLVASCEELFDLAQDDSAWNEKYSQDLLAIRRNLALAYRKLSPRLDRFSLNFIYASRGDAEIVGKEVDARSKQLAGIGSKKFPGATVSFEFVGASRLVTLYRQRPTYELELKFTASLSQGERYVLLAELSDYFRFVTDGGKLRRYLFDSNVRDFMGENRVNEDIRMSLENRDEGAPDFWWLNNGVTILATAATIIGQSIKLSNIQIVNGLQTTESVFRHLSSLNGESDNRLILIKVIVTDEDRVRDAIIRATNNQTTVELASLRATDKVQRDVEDILHQNGIYYERRKNFYVNQGISPTDIVTPLYAGAGYLALVLKHPETAATLKSKFMRKEELYASIFSPEVDFRVWPHIVGLLKLVDNVIDSLRPISVSTDRFLKGWRYVTAFVVLSRRFGKYTYTVKDLIDLDVGSISNAEIKSAYDFLLQYPRTPNFRAFWTFRRNFLNACQDLTQREGIDGYAFLAGRPHATEGDSYRNEPNENVDEELLERAKGVIPPQPWKPGVHKDVMEILGISNVLYSRVIDVLVAEGVLLNQRDGVLYDLDGNVVRFDEERVDPITLQLKSGTKRGIV